MERFGIETYIFSLIEWIFWQLLSVGNIGMGKAAVVSTYLNNNPAVLVRLSISFIICTSCLPLVRRTIRAFFKNSAGDTLDIFVEVFFCIVHTAFGVFLSKYLTFPTLLLIGIPITFIDIIFYTIIRLTDAGPNGKYTAAYPFVRIFVTITVLNICYSLSD